MQGLAKLIHSRLWLIQEDSLYPRFSDGDYYILSWNTSDSILSITDSEKKGKDAHIAILQVSNILVSVPDPHTCSLHEIWKCSFQEWVGESGTESSNIPIT